MKRVEYKFGQSLNQKNYWRSPAEAVNTPEVQEARAREFGDDAHLLDPVSRRSFLAVMGASAGLAGLVACRRPEEKILPYSRPPEDAIPGRAEYYATAMAWGGTAVGLLVESHEGRPTKMEGNPRHPDSAGGLNIWLQASVLDLYDVDRSQSPVSGGQPRSWGEATTALKARAEALKAAGGKGLVILTESHRSPSTAREEAELRKVFPQAKVHRWEPLSRDHVRAGTKMAFGKPLEPVHQVAAAKVLCSLDSDFLQTEDTALKNARAFGEQRKLAAGAAAMSRLYAVGSVFSVTAANADHRLAVPSSQVGEFVGALAKELSASHGIDLGEVTAAVAGFNGDRFGGGKWVKALAKDLAANKGASLLVAGVGQPPAVHALVAHLNAALENVGTTVSYVKPWDKLPDGAASISALAEAMNKKEVDTLVILGGNPVFTAPSDVGFAAALHNVPHTFHLSSHEDETSAACAWHLNRAHPLETWGDVRALDGTLSPVQPLIAPIFEGKTDGEVLSILRGEPMKAHDVVRVAWVMSNSWGMDFDKNWRRALHDGVQAGSAFPPAAVEVNAAEVAAAAKELGAKGGGLEVTFNPDTHAWDGRFTNNGWLQELPDPMTKVSWDNTAWLAMSTAKKLGVTEGQKITVTVPGGKPVTLPVVFAPGQAEDSIALSLGQGRSKVGVVGEGVGFDVYPARTSAGMFFATGAQVQPAGGDKHQVARTQEHHAMEGRHPVREGTFTQWQGDPAFAQKMVKLPPMLSIFEDEWKYEGHKWGLAIDLNACIGCSACMVACQAENNIPITGKFGVGMSREMHWIRVDRYYEGTQEDPQPRAVFQPIPCMQCEGAPCETVCPVAATSHSPEGLNDMAYNRCIGTRYCANNCPYKVRRFNFLDYSKDFTSVKKGVEHGTFIKEPYQELRKMQFNPDVTVRMRGVMEKCTYCVQRITEAKIASKREKRTLKDGEIITACQQTCPTGAIHFGDLNLKDAAVVKQKQDGRNYVLLEELNVRPRTSYLAKVRNPNPELA